MCNIILLDTKGEKQMKEKKCGNGRGFAKYYTKAYCEFVREDYGYCYETKKAVRDSEVCECWKSKLGRRRKITRPMVLRVLEKGLTNITCLKQIFADNEDMPNED